MDFAILTETYKKIDSTTKRLEITDIISDFLNRIDDNEIGYIVLFLMGKIFPDYDEREIGVSSKIVEKAIIKVSGINPQELQDKVNELGDIGKVTEFFMKKKRQRTLGSRSVKTEDFLEAMERMALLGGKGTIKNKIDIVAGLLSNSSPEDAKYISKLIIGELRVGAGEGSVRDAIAKAFGVDKSIVERAWNLTPNYGRVAFIAKTEGEEGLVNSKITLGIPIVSQLAEKSKGLEEVLAKVKNPVVEIKYDGLRSQIHKDGDRVWIFTRRLENVTKQFPDLVKHIKKAIKSKKIIVDSETLAVDSNGRPLPFQVLSQRIQRKYDIDSMVKKVNIQTEVFDIILLNDKLLFDLPLKERWKVLKGEVKEVSGVGLAKQLRTNDFKKADNFYRKSLDMGQEGVMVKNLDAGYKPGRRVGYWFKVKPVMESLDLVVTGATYGSGKRAGTFSSFILSCKKGDSFVPVGMMATGIKEKKNDVGDITYQEMTEMFKPLVTSEKSNEVQIKPKIVFEVEYQEIQRSPTYESGFALRFPRFIRIRQDKDPRNADDVSRVRRLYNLQGGKK